MEVHEQDCSDEIRRDQDGGYPRVKAQNQRQAGQRLSGDDDQAEPPWQPHAGEVMHRARRREDEELERRMRKESQSSRYTQYGCAIWGRIIVYHGPFLLRLGGYFAHGRSRHLAHDLVLKDPDTFDFEFDHVAVLEKAPLFEAAAVPDRSRAEEFPGMDGLVLGRVGENLLEGEQHAGRGSGGAQLSLHANRNVESLGIAQLVRRHDPGPEYVAAVEALALGGTEAALHLDRLPVARRKIVEDRVAEDVRPHLPSGDVGARALCDDPEF